MPAASAAGDAAASPRFTFPFAQVDAHLLLETPDAALAAEGMSSQQTLQGSARLILIHSASGGRRHTDRAR